MEPRSPPVAGRVRQAGDSIGRGKGRRVVVCGAKGRLLDGLDGS
jgi:hypothetical protein